MPCREATAHRLHFEPLFDGQRTCAFPCDAGGKVDLDALDEQARNLYFYVRAVVGREFATPIVRLAVPRQDLGTLSMRLV